MTQPTHTPSGIPIPAHFFAAQKQWMLALDEEATKLAAEIEQGPDATELTRRAGASPWLQGLARDLAAERAVSPRYAAVCAMYRQAVGARDGTRQMFITEYRKLVLASAKPRKVVAATEIVGGELVVCEGNALGPVVGRFPRTEEGAKAARALVEAE